MIKPIAYLIAIVVIIFSCKSDQSKSYSSQEVLDIKFTQEGKGWLVNNDTIIKSFEIEFATSARQRNQGLMYRSKLEENQSMLFIHPEEEVGKLKYWMKNTRIPLDIIFLSPDTLVINIAKNAQPHQLEVEGAKENARFVLEINGGLSDEWGIKEGLTKLRWKSNN